MTTSPRVAIKTLGCKLNQYESEQIREDFEAMGFSAVAFDDEAEVYLINSCTVTHRTDRDARRLARQARRRSPSAMIIVTGCYAQMQPEVLEALEVVDLIAPNERKSELAAAAVEWLSSRGISCTPGEAVRDPERLVSRFPDNTRAFVQVQTGCDAECAYCIITKARGPSRSMGPEAAVRQARLLAESGHPEVVLVGIHLGMYGQDLPDKPTLDELVRMICEIEPLRRLRLSSIEPREVTRGIVEMVCAGGNALDGGGEPACAGKLCRHLHIPLQSGCDATLGRMGRPYDAAFYRELVERIAAREPRVSIGADVLVGFPGETDQEFAATLDLVRELPLSYLHVFTYSARPGTRAAEMPDPVNPEVRKQRTHLLRAVSEEKARQFAARMVGERLEVVVETPRDEAGRLTGISDNYLRVHLEGPDLPVGSLVAVNVTAAIEGEVSGSLALPR